MMNDRELIGELQIKLNEALQKLSPSQRSLVILNDIEGLPSNQIALVADLSEKKMRGQLGEAHRQLQRFLDPYLKTSELLKGEEWKIADLLLLKKLETPGKEYFDHFLAEFQRYQRTELLTEASSRNIFDRVGDWLFPIPRPALVWSTALALFAILAVAVPMNVGTHQQGSSFIPAVAKIDKVVNDPLPFERANFSDSTPNAYYTDAVRQQPELQKSVAYAEGDLSYPRYVTGESSDQGETSLAF